MTRQDINQALLQTSFLYGANGAYIEALQARYEKRPDLGRAGLARFLRRARRRSRQRREDRERRLVESAQLAGRAQGRSDQRARRRLAGDGKGDRRQAARQGGGDRERGSAASDEAIHRATRDSVRALMMIRAFRMRGHLHANLDPLGLEPQKDHEELHPAELRLRTRADYDRKIFIDHVLGLEFATVREMLAILRRTYCGTIGFEFIHISDPAEKALDSGAHRGAGQGDPVHQGGQARDPQQARRGRGLREILRRQIPRRQALRPRRRARR